MSPLNSSLQHVCELLDLVAEDRAESAPDTVISKDSQMSGLHILLDILLTDSWELAMIKVAIATSEKRADTQLTSASVAKLKAKSWNDMRATCRHYARRLAGDEDGLDLAWLMLAADPAQPWTYGFLQRLADHVLLRRGATDRIEDALRTVIMERFDRWEQIRDGFPALAGDPFKSVMSHQWYKARDAFEEKKRKLVEKSAATTAATAAVVDKFKSLATPPQEDAQEVSGGLRVINGEYKLAPAYKALATADTKLHLTPPVLPVRAVLRIEFPHCADVIDMMLIDLREGEPLHWRPMLLLGEPGCGKSRLVRRLAELLGAAIRRFDGAGSSDNSFGGTPKQWSTARPCFPLTVIAETQKANPVLLIDEIDKAGSGYYNGSLGQALMPFLERETASKFPDPGFELEADLSCVNYILTANDATKLPKPLRDRLRVIKVPSPGRAHLAGLVASIIKDLAVDLNRPMAFMPKLAQDELAVIARAWGDDGSVRKLQKIVSATVTARDKCASRH
jgi:hypothetical protein